MEPIYFFLLSFHRSFLFLPSNIPSLSPFLPLAIFLFFLFEFPPSKLISSLPQTSSPFYSLFTFFPFNPPSLPSLLHCLPSHPSPSYPSFLLLSFSSFLLIVPSYRFFFYSTSLLPSPLSFFLPSFLPLTYPLSLSSLYPFPLPLFFISLACFSSYPSFSHPFFLLLSFISPAISPASSIPSCLLLASSYPSILFLFFSPPFSPLSFLPLTCLPSPYASFLLLSLSSPSISLPFSPFHRSSYTCARHPFRDNWDLDYIKEVKSSEVCTPETFHLCSLNSKDNQVRTIKYDIIYHTIL